MANQLNWCDKVSFSSGDTIKVYQKVKEADKTRTQVFEGVVIRIKGNPGSKSFTVRKIGANKVGVEKIFPEDTPAVSKIEVVKRGKVRRANLSYLKEKATKKETRIKDRFVRAEEEEKELKEKAGEKSERKTKKEESKKEEKASDKDKEKEE